MLPFARTQKKKQRANDFLPKRWSYHGNENELLVGQIAMSDSADRQGALDFSLNITQSWRSTPPGKPILWLDLHRDAHTGYACAFASQTTKPHIYQRREMPKKQKKKEIKKENKTHNQKPKLQRATKQNKNTDFITNARLF